MKTPKMGRAKDIPGLGANGRTGEVVKRFRFISEMVDWLMTRFGHPFLNSSVPEITPGLSLVAVFFAGWVGQPPSRPLWTDVMSEVQRGCIGEADWLDRKSVV